MITPQHLTALFFLIAPIILGQGALARTPDPRMPAPVIHVKAEAITLSAERGNRWAGGTRLAQVRSGYEPGTGLPVPYALNVNTVTVGTTDGRLLTRGEDYVINGVYGTLSLGPRPTVTANDAVVVSYQVGHRRIDSVIRDASGKLILREGTSDITAPQPPDLSPGETRVGNYFLDYFNRAEDAAWFPVTHDAASAPTETVSRSHQRTLAKLRAGDSVRIVCWGDSITNGGDVSSPDKAYPAVFASRLRERFPNTSIEVKAVAVGGSSSRNWLYQDKYPHPTAPAYCDMERIFREKPDLVTVEFLNDASMSQDQVDKYYADLVARLRAADCEVLLITPNFTSPEQMGDRDPRASDGRPYVQALKRFASANNLSLADASARWEHLWKEGIPYVTLIKNAINHPDDRGHALYADELIKCFQ